MALIAPGICRFTINGTFAGQQVDNVLDMQIDTTGSTVSRSDAINAQAGILINQWVTDIIPNLPTTYSFGQVTWVDLDSAGGSTGARSTSGAITLPVAGSATGEAYAANVAALIKKTIQGNRNRRNGRLYYGPLHEGTVTTNNLTSAFRTTLQSDFTAFLGNINQEEGGPSSYTSQLVVVHTTVPSPGAEPVFVAWSPVLALTVESRLATQRRRLRD